MKTLEDTDLESKNVLLRTDLNLPVEDGEPRKTVRFERYMDTVHKLREENAKTVVVAHQGRPARKDFLSLEKHAELISEEINDDVRFVQTFFGPQLGDAVASMEKGDVVLLENIRFLSEELQNVSKEIHSDDFFVQNMSKYFDLFVNDAFSAAHRSHGSLVGFTSLLDSYAGELMDRELESCKKIRDELDNPVLVLGGEKPSDVIQMLENMIERVDKVLLGGVPGELALTVKGLELGEKSDWIREHGYNSSAKDLQKLMEEYEDKIMVPRDLRTDSGNHETGDVPENEMTWDIGVETVESYVEEIKKADSVLMKGPMGAFEDYPEGTRKVVDAMAENKGFTVLGGGHTSSLVERFGHSSEDFSHVSIAGGAFVRFMSGEELPAVEALKDSS